MGCQTDKWTHVFSAISMTRFDPLHSPVTQASIRIGVCHFAQGALRRANV
jgi:hypothetical protein